MRFFEGCPQTRLILPGRANVLHIGSTAGFVPGGLFYFESKKTVYDDEMIGDIFLEWFEKILPLLEDNAVIVMDNAPYHFVLEKRPDALWTKAAIIEWLKNKGMVADMTMLKAELLQIVALIKDKYVLDDIAKEHKKIVLKLPPCAYQLNPIEMAWSMVKEYVKSHNNICEIDDVKALFEIGIIHVTAQHWSNFMRHVIEEEERLWRLDEVMDKMIDDLLLNAENISDKSDSDSD